MDSLEVKRKWQDLGALPHYSDEPWRVEVVLVSRQRRSKRR